MSNRITTYIDKIPPAISGQGGHSQTFKVAMILLEGFGLSEAEAMTYLSYYNDRCQPQWSQSELVYKIKSASKQINYSKRGYLNKRKAL